jgi:AcrR family transcriptional regulator
MKSRKKAYHHGDLRAAVMTEGLRLLEKSSVDALSLREVARNIEVSATAIYRHFPDKAALLRALAQAGAEQLGREQKAAHDRAGGGKSGFVATGRAYVRFALQNAALFRLIMSSSGPCETSAPADAADNFAMNFLRQNVAAILPADATARRNQVEVYRAWAMVHGLAMLMLDGQIKPDDTLIDMVIDESPAARP